MELYKLICPKCSQERMVSRHQFLYAQKHNKQLCRKCSQTAWRSLPEKRLKLSVVMKQSEKVQKHIQKLIDMGRGRAAWNKGRLTKQSRSCPHCAKQFIYKNNYQVCCSRECAHRKRVSDGTHHWWKGGITPLNFAVRTTVRYKNWKKAVIERDGYQCAHCETKSRPGAFHLMHVDHIVPLSHLLTENEVTTVYDAIECEALWDITNGRVLCRDCHTQTDTYASRALTYNN